MATMRRLMSDSPFRSPDGPLDLPALDRRILTLWDDIDAFQTSVDMRSEDDEYIFYDGPPFATGSPHYGNLLAGVIKDIVPRYWTMQGHRIERRFGWDTHGLPVEMEVQKRLELSGAKAIEAYGVDRFNEACRSIVNETVEEWETITRRMGRWVDFENDYKTMDVDFMESVWWVFKQLWDKGLIEQSFKVLPYSWGASTPLSNFEVNLGGYRDVEDPSITVRLEILADHGPLRAGDFLLIWTTTPWTLPSNLAVAVGTDLEYSAVNVEGDRYWLASALVTTYWPDAEPGHRVAGSDLLGAEYEPPFDYFGEERDRGAFRVIASDDVTTDEGTGLVHMAPAYGEADFHALQAAGLDVLVDPVDPEGNFTDEVTDVAGLNIKEADKPLVRLMAERGQLIRNERTVHSYPFCWRTDTPLIYKAFPTWFVRVEKIRDRMAELNLNIHWVPDHVGERRFGNWLEDARDWAISRNRYWGSCIPVWECDDCHEQVCVGSVDELEELSGVRLTDLHKHFVDPVTFPCTRGDGTMRRVPEVLDCWFESGAMPYAQIHYPFENRERFERGFPAQFIAEGLDQTRGWFYTLVVLATALFDREPFQNVIVFGLILAEDGKKMSKSLRNYPDPADVLDHFGADALRAYLIDSPLLRAEPLRFREAGVRDVVRSVLLPLWNAYTFFSTYAEADGITLDDLRAAPSPDDRPELDRWILSVLQTLISSINREMQGYYLYAVIRPTLEFIDDLTNWYIRRSRRRFWRARSDDDADKVAAFATLYEVLVTFSRVLAPVLPFITEELHQLLVVETGANGPRSVHHADFPVPDDGLIDEELESAMAAVRTGVRLGHALRKRQQMRVRQPLAQATFVSRSAEVRAWLHNHSELISDELNVKDVRVEKRENDLVHITAKANFKTLGPRLGRDVQQVAAAIEALGPDELEPLLAGDAVEVAGVTVGPDDVDIRREPHHGLIVATDAGITVALDVTVTKDLEVEGLARELISSIQQLRRDAGLDVADRVRLTWSTDDGTARSAFAAHGELIATEVLAAEIVEGQAPAVDVAGVEVGLGRARLEAALPGTTLPGVIEAVFGHVSDRLIGALVERR